MTPWIAQLVKHFSGSISNDQENKDDPNPENFELKWNPHDQGKGGLFSFSFSYYCYILYSGEKGLKMEASILPP